MLAKGGIQKQVLILFTLLNLDDLMQNMGRFMRKCVSVTSCCPLAKNIYIFLKKKQSETAFKLKPNQYKPFVSVWVSVSKILPETEPSSFRFGKKGLKLNQTKLPQHYQ